MNEAWCKKWAAGEWEDPKIGEKLASKKYPSYMGACFAESQSRLQQASKWALEQYKLREKETNDLLERNGQLVADAKHAAATILRLQVEIQRLEGKEVAPT